jgi:two-component system cell cycle sensor histidine kinase/response regulator CckA
VADSGKGISSTEMPHIFEPFFTTKPVGQGTGLGLAQVYGIIKQHDGTIDVNSQPGQGTRFSVYLPLVEFKDEYVLPERRPFQQIPGKGEKVLLVEDDPTARQALQVVLNTLNYKPVTASNGEEALQEMARDGNEIKLIISDIVMPVMGGVELYHRLGQENSPAKFLFVTGHPMDADNQALLEVGRVHWLQKPFSMQEFSQAIKDLMEEP